MDIVRLIVWGLAIYRLSRMLALERGPFNVCENFRGVVAKRFGPTHWISEGIACPLCISFWFAGLGSMVYVWGPLDGVLLWLMNFFAIWGAMAAITVIATKQERP